MAMSGYCDSWVSNQSTGYGAYYRWSWTATKVSSGVTRINWSLQGRGRTSSPTWLYNECYITVSSVGQIYALPYESNQNMSDGTNTSFNQDRDKSWRTSGSFNVQHTDANPLTLNVTIRASYYYGAGTGQTVTRTMTIDANSPAAAKIWNGSSWVTATPYVWNGSSWVIATPYIWNGSSWVISKA